MLRQPWLRSVAIGRDQYSESPIRGAAEVDTTRSKQSGIGRHGRKTDRIDAEVLALALDRGGIPVAHVLSPQRQSSGAGSTYGERSSSPAHRW
jgi:hypothetical protein